MRTLLIRVAVTSVLYCLCACNKQSIIEGFIPQQPAVDSIAPTIGLPGTQIKIYGQWHDSAKSDITVLIGDDTAKILAFTDSTMTVTAPINVATGAVSVTTSNGTATGPKFILISDTSAPTKSLGFVRIHNVIQTSLYLNVSGQTLQATTASTDYWERIAIGDSSMGYCYWREKTSGLYLHDAGNGTADLTTQKSSGAIWRVGASNAFLMQNWNSKDYLYVLSGHIYSNNNFTSNSGYQWQLLK